MKIINKPLVLLLTGASLLVLTASSVLASSLIDPFLGEYKGHVEYEEDGEQKKRDLGVTIGVTEEGFNM